MNKVTIEITKDGWKTDIEFNGKKYTEEHESTKTGARGVKGNFYNEADLPENLKDALGGFHNYHIMEALHQLEFYKK